MNELPELREVAQCHPEAEGRGIYPAAPATARARRRARRRTVPPAAHGPGTGGAPRSGTGWHWVEMIVPYGNNMESIRKDQGMCFLGRWFSPRTSAVDRQRIDQAAHGDG